MQHFSTPPKAMKMLLTGFNHLRANLSVALRLAFCYALCAYAAQLTITTVFGGMLATTGASDGADAPSLLSFSTVIAVLPSLYLLFALLNPYARLISPNQHPPFAGGISLIFTTGLRQSAHFFLANLLVYMLSGGITTLLNILPPIFDKNLVLVIGLAFGILLGSIGSAAAFITIANESVGHKTSIFDTLATIRGRLGPLIGLNFMMILLGFVTLWLVALFIGLFWGPSEIVQATLTALLAIAGYMILYLAVGLFIGGLTVYPGIFYTQKAKL